MKTLLALFVVTLAGCVTAPQIDYSKADKQCSRGCASEYSECQTGFKLFPLAAQAGCNESLKVCVATCGATVVSN